MEKWVSTLVSIGVGILMSALIFFLKPSLPLLVFLLIAAYFCFAFGVWFCPWIRDRVWRRLVSLLMLAGCVFIIGFLIRPIEHPTVSSKTEEKKVAEQPKKAAKTSPQIKSQPEKTEPEKQELPDMTLRFVYKKEPALVLDNISGKIVRDIKWGVFLWNYDLPERNDPLPIPMSTFDWIRPHDHSVPLNLFGLPNVPPLIKTGDRLFGTASIVCAECSRGRAFFIYIKLGEGGWYVEHPTDKSGGILAPKDWTKQGRNRFYEEILSIPIQLRIPILDPF